MEDRLAHLLENPEAVCEVAPKDCLGLFGALQTRKASINTLEAALMQQMAEGKKHQEPDRLLTVDETAGILKVEKDWLYRQARNGNLPFVVRLTIGQVRFSSLGLQRYIRQRTGQ